jgi:hypothetical protein
VKCVGDHLTRDCQLGNKIKPKCVNCDGDHTANNTICPEYQKKLEAAQESRNRNNTKSEKFVPAPFPKVSNVPAAAFVAAHKPRPRPQTPTLTATPKPHHHHQTAKILKFLNGGSKNFEFVMKDITFKCP